MSAAEPGSSTHTIETIDVIIGMDATGSMSSWIEAARDTVLKAFDDLRETYPNAHFRLGLVCYRDFGDAEQFVTCALTENIQDVQNSLRNVKASGGNDTSEDVAGGLARIVDMFRAPPQAGGDVRILLFVADAPAHGLRYHAATVSDRYPRGDPEDREPADQMSELARMGVDTTLFRIDKAMDKMIEEFSTAYTTVAAEEADAGTFTLLDVVSQSAILPSAHAHAHAPGPFLSSSAALLASASASLSSASGFIDLATYDGPFADDPVHLGCSDDLPVLPPPQPLRPSISTADTFYSATQLSVAQSVEKRRERRSRDVE